MGVTPKIGKMQAQSKPTKIPSSKTGVKSQPEWDLNQKFAKVLNSEVLFSKTKSPFTAYCDKK